MSERLEAWLTQHHRPIELWMKTGCVRVHEKTKDPLQELGQDSQKLLAVVEKTLLHELSEPRWPVIMASDQPLTLGAEITKNVRIFQAWIDGIVVEQKLPACLLADDRAAPSLSQLALSLGMGKLLHTTRLKSLESILLSGQLLPPSHGVSKASGIALPHEKREEWGDFD